MFAAAFAAITAFQVVLFCENFVTLFIIVKVLVFFDGILIHLLNPKGRKYYLCFMIIVSRGLLKNTKISAITLFPFILLRNADFKNDAVLLNHEKIHLQQQRELLIIFFYIWYVLEYYYLVFKLKNRFLAYKSISFEREAYGNENDLTYLEKRKLWSFWKYLP